MALAGTRHLSGSYWGFTLMSIYMGPHWGIVTGEGEHERIKVMIKIREKIVQDGR